MAKAYEKFLTPGIKDEIINYYIKQNHSLKESQAYLQTKYGITQANLIGIMRFFNLHKPKNLHVEQIKKAKLVNHGSENYNGHIDFKFKYTPEEEKQICDRYLAGENIGAINKDLHTHKVKAILLKNKINLRSEEENKQIKIKKIQQTNKAKYGVENVAKSKGVIKRIKTTWQNKSDAERKIIRNKAAKKYRYDGINFDSSWEVAFYIYHKDHGYDIKREAASFEYSYQGKKHKYFVDFTVNGVYYELKSDYLYKYMITQKESVEHAKYECMLKNGIIILKSNDMQRYLDYVIKKYGANFLQSCKNK